MKWCVMKTGIERFDALHAYGLGVVVACTYENPADMYEDALCYTIHCTSSIRSQHGGDDLFNIVCPLPTEEMLCAMYERREESQTYNEEERLAVHTLDGLLAALLTVPHGVRCCSIADLIDKEAHRPSVLRDGIQKVQAQWTKWKGRILQQTQGSSDWLHDLLEEYRPDATCVPLFQPSQSKIDITVTMTIEPILSYASRNPLSDARVTNKTNMTVRGTRFAAWLAYIGASRFLRAQRVLGDFINYYVPLTRFLRIHRTTTFPCLSSVEHSPTCAFVLHWLSTTLSPLSSDVEWRGWVYQALQVQGKQQPLSRQQGYVESGWLHTVKERVGHNVLLYWNTLLSEPLSECPLEKEELIDALLSRHTSAWEAHVLQTAQALASVNRDDNIRRYRRHELQEMSIAMEVSHLSPLSAILERKEGTLRFGHALRLLQQNNPADGNDAIEELEGVSTRDQLIDVLGHAVQRCSLAFAKSQFLIVPSDDDLKYLLDDIDRYSAQTLARVLILLSALHYPHVNRFDGRTLWRLLTALLKALPLQKSMEMEPHTESEANSELLEGEV